MSAGPTDSLGDAVRVLAGYRQWLRGQITGPADADDWASWAGRLAARLSSLTEDPARGGGGTRRPESPSRTDGSAREPGDPLPVTYAEAAAAYQFTAGHGNGSRS